MSETAKTAATDAIIGAGQPAASAPTGPFDLRGNGTSLSREHSPASPPS